MDRAGGWVRYALRPKGELSEAAQRIGGGHAFRKHAHEFGFKTEAEMKAHVDRVLRSPSATRKLDRGRTAYWDESSQSVVITNPRDADLGTVFRPPKGRRYFDELR